MLTDTLVSTQVRWVHTDGKGHRPDDQQFPQWLGESIGFWDGTALVIHTNQIRQWNATHSLFEWSDQLTAVERYERVGNEIVAEVTLYDPRRIPLSVARPFQADSRPEERPDGLQHLHGYERAVEQHLCAS